MKIYYVANARMPNEKAHGIQMAKMCEALVESGVDLTLLVSNRGSGSLKQFYGLTCEIPTRRLPVVDLQFFGPIGYRVTALQFIIRVLLYLFVRLFKDKMFVVYTIDMDSFSFAPLICIPRPVFAEMHSVKKVNFLTRTFFKRAKIIATNQPIADDLSKEFNISPHGISVEPNGVDEAALRDFISQQDARRKLNLPLDKSFALYVGRFYKWKGMEILADAATDSILPIYVVGGGRDEYESVTGRSGERLHFVGGRPTYEIVSWLAAADVLIVLGTANNKESYSYTSPMKIFEYLAAGRPTVSSRTPAVMSILREGVTFWYEPDNAQSLGKTISLAYTSPESKAKVQKGRELTERHTWRKRTERILNFIKYGN
ncbi:glycosyltransferase family 4 protein [Candidatus Nomurabacteria bacterium]|nr:glycosyltransferase family 4 protein [Candidatus Nomurabacteria bacterium]